VRIGEGGCLLIGFNCIVDTSNIFKQCTEIESRQNIFRICLERLMVMVFSAVIITRFLQQPPQINMSI
jgi:hypothetical protein